MTITEGSKKTIFRDCASTVSWSVADTSIASVNSKSTVTAKKPGKTTLTATIGSKKYTCTLVVEKDKNALPDKKEYDARLQGGFTTLSNGDVVGSLYYDYNIPMEARIDLFKLTYGDDSNLTGEYHELPNAVSEGAFYMEYKDYYVTYPSSIRGGANESYDRVYDLFKELGILDQPDYVKAREIAVWMKSTKTYGSSDSPDGTWLGIDKLICGYAAGMYQEFMWLLDIPCKCVSSTKLNHEWNVIQLDGKWYQVDTTPYIDETSYKRDWGMLWWETENTRAITKYNADLSAIGGKANAGNDYMYGCKVLKYDTVDDFYADLENKDSKFWESYNRDHGYAICIKSYLYNDANGEIRGEKMRSFLHDDLAPYEFALDKDRNIFFEYDNKVLTYYFSNGGSPTWNGYPNISTHPETYNPKLKPLSSYLK